MSTKKKEETEVSVISNVVEAITADHSKGEMADTLSNNTIVSKADFKKDIGFCTYIGPTIRGALQKGTIFKGSKEEVLCNEAIKSALEKYPLISSLIIPGHSLSESLIKITTPGNYLYENYRKLSVK